MWTSAWLHSKSQGMFTQRRPGSVYENGSVTTGAEFAAMSRPVWSCVQIDECVIRCAETTKTSRSTPRATYTS